VDINTKIATAYPAYKGDCKWGYSIKGGRCDGVNKKNI
jgi:hypothetical protein